MAGQVIDTIAVASDFLPEGFLEGLAQAQAQFARFRQSVAEAGTPVTLDFTLTGADQAIAQAKEVQASLSPASFQEFSAATTQALTRVAASLDQLNATLAPVKRAVDGFFAGITQNAAQEAAAVEQSAARQAAAFRNLGQSPFARIAGDVRLASADLAAGKIQLDDYVTAVQQADSEIQALRANGFEPSAQQLGVLNEALGRSTVALGTHTRGTNLAKNALVILAAQSLGTSSTVGRLAESVLLFSGGATAVIAVAGAVLAVASAYDTLTASSRHAQEQLDRAAASVRQLRENAGSAVTDAARNLEAVSRALASQQEQVNRLFVQREAGFFSGTITGIGTAIAAVFKLRAAQEELNALVQDEVTARQLAAQAATDEFNALRQFQAQQQAALTSVLTNAIGLGTDTPESIRQRAIESDRLRAIIRDTTNSLAERNDAAEKLQGILDAQNALLERQRQLALQVAQALQDVQTSAAEATANALRVIAQATAALPVDQFRTLIAQQRADRGPALTVGIEAGFDRAVQGAENLDRELIRTNAQANKTFREMVQRALDTRNAVERLNDAIHDTTRGLDAVIRGASAIGLIGDEASRSLSAVLDLADAIGNVLESASTGNILAAVGAGLSAIGAIAGADEHDRLVAENNRRLAELNATIGRTNGAAEVATAAQLAKIGAGLTPDILRGKNLGSDAVREFEQAVQDSGLTLQQFAAIIKEQTGLEILDSKGHLVARTLAQVDDALKVVEERLTHFGTSIDEQARVLETADKFGIGGRSSNAQVAALQRTRELELANLNLDPATEARIRGLDLETEAGRQAFREFNKELFEAARLGQLTLEQLGQFQNVTDLLGPINDAVDQIDAFTNATQDATKALQDLNVPTGFRRFAKEFEAQQPTPPAAPPPPTSGPITPLAPPPGGLRGTDFNPQIGSDGAQLPSLTSTLRPIVVQWSGNLVIEGAGQDADALAETVVAKLRDIAVGQSGDTLQVPIL